MTPRLDTVFAALADPTRRAEMGANALEWTKARYHWSAICDAWQELAA